MGLLLSWRLRKQPNELPVCHLWWPCAWFDWRIDANKLKDKLTKQDTNNHYKFVITFDPRPKIFFQPTF